MNEDAQDVLKVPVIQVKTDGDDGSCIEFIEVDSSEVLEYNGDVVALTDGSRWISVAEVKIHSEPEENETILEPPESSTEEHIEVSTEGGSEECIQNVTQVILLDDGRIAYVQSSDGSNNAESSSESSDVSESQPVPKQAKGKKGKNYICFMPGCNRAYTSLHHLKVHHRNHTGDRPFKCSAEGCTKAFSTDYSRKAHLRTHTGEKPYPCPSINCKKEFKTSGDLQKHIRTHTGERPFTCPVQGCNRSFTTSNIRKVHIRTHTGEKPYLCTHEGCDKSFASSTNFKNHMRIHSGIKPYCCKVPNCLKRFTEYSSLYKHQLVHSQQKKHQCNFCQKTYRQSSTLTTHKRTTHGVISADDGTEIVIEDMIGLGDPRSKKFKDLTSKLLKLKKNCSTLVTIEEEGAPLYLVSTQIDGLNGLEDGEILL